MQALWAEKGKPPATPGDVYCRETEVDGRRAKHIAMEVLAEKGGYRFQYEEKITSSKRRFYRNSPAYIAHVLKNLHFMQEAPPSDALGQWCRSSVRQTPREKLFCSVALSEGSQHTDKTCDENRVVSYR